MATLLIKSEKDISKIRLGDSYSVEGPSDPEEFFEFLKTLEPAIDAHIDSLLNRETPEQADLKERYTVVELRKIAAAQSVRGRSKLNKDGLIAAIDWDKV